MNYVGKIEKHIRPTLGRHPVGRVKAETVEGLYAQLRRCRDHCRGRAFVQHRTALDNRDRSSCHDLDPRAVGGVPGSCLLSFAMAPHGAPPGAVNIYSREARAFDDTAKAIAGGFAMQAAIVVYGAERVSELEEALQSRDVIGQAKGILMHRDGIDAGAAFAKLVRASQDTNMKLVDVARWLTGQVTRSVKDDGPSHSPDAPIAR